MSEIKKIFTVLLLAFFTITFSVSCSSDEEISEQPKGEVQIQVATYAVTGDGESTASSNRAAFVKDNNQYKPQFASGDVLLVWGTKNSKYFYGFLTLKSGAGSASGSFSGTLNVEGSDTSINPLDNPTEINAILAPSGWNTKGYSYVENTHSYKHSTYTPVSSMEQIGPYVPIEKTSYDSSNRLFTLDLKGNITHVTLYGLSASVDYTIYAYNQSGGTNYCNGTINTDANGVLDFYLPTTLDAGYYYKVSRSGETDYIADVTQQAFSSYTKKILKIARADLSRISRHITIGNGTVCSGTTSSYGVTISDGASVTLNGASLTSNGSYAPIACSGTATINLVGTNTVVSKTSGYSGIQPASGKTLTIQGSGSLSITGGSGAAGIGAGGGTTCGNITIAGGTITATGGEHGAGIGSGCRANNIDSKCGNITISGGTITAAGGTYGAGIGSGSLVSGGASQCGNIAISGGSVTATGGTGAAGIGTGNSSNCGTITIEKGASYIEMRRQEAAASVEADGCYYILGKADVGSNCGTITIDGKDNTSGVLITSSFDHYNSTIDGNHLWWKLTPKNN